MSPPGGSASPCSPTDGCDRGPLRRRDPPAAGGGGGPRRTDALVASPAARDPDARVDERPERSRLGRRPLPPVLPAPSRRCRLGPDVVGSRDEPRPRELDRAPGGHPGDPARVGLLRLRRPRRGRRPGCRLHRRRPGDRPTDAGPRDVVRRRAHLAAAPGQPRPRRGLDAVPRPEGLPVRRRRRVRPLGHGRRARGRARRPAVDVGRPANVGAHRDGGSLRPARRRPPWRRALLLGGARPRPGAGRGRPGPGGLGAPALGEPRRSGGRVGSGVRGRRLRRPDLRAARRGRGRVRPLLVGRPRRGLLRRVDVHRPARRPAPGRPARLGRLDEQLALRRPDAHVAVAWRGDPGPVARAADRRRPAAARPASRAAGRY